ncbi:hypothetical protein [Spiroplasma endosymbiont of Dilophus febrilis]|uniref:hypothetical protein n=1 Tax=Spiroplasma endosymbiont of Dilophus febrilis TaxID=3066292 RepID=UPI00313EBEB1
MLKKNVMVLILIFFTLINLVNNNLNNVSNNDSNIIGNTQKLKMEKDILIDINEFFDILKNDNFIIFTSEINLDEPENIKSWFKNWLLEVETLLFVNQNKRINNLQSIILNGFKQNDNNKKMELFLKYIQKKGLEDIYVTISFQIVDSTIEKFQEWLGKHFKNKYLTLREMYINNITDISRSQLFSRIPFVQESFKKSVPMVIIFNNKKIFMTRIFFMLNSYKRDSNVDMIAEFNYWRINLKIKIKMLKFKNYKMKIYSYMTFLLEIEEKLLLSNDSRNEYWTMKLKLSKAELIQANFIRRLQVFHSNLGFIYGALSTFWNETFNYLNIYPLSFELENNFNPNWLENDNWLKAQENFNVSFVFKIKEYKFDSGETHIIERLRFDFVFAYPQ